MTHTDAIAKLRELLDAVETLRADKPIGPATAAAVRATALRILDSYLIAKDSRPRKRPAKRNRTTQKETRNG